MKLLCKLGWHIPIKFIEYLFTDVVNHRPVNHYKCSCGKDWMAHSILNSFSFKIKKESKCKKVL
jgi:hypothetical protein